MSASASGGFDVGFGERFGKRQPRRRLERVPAHAGQDTWSRSTDKSTTASVSMVVFSGPDRSPLAAGRYFQYRRLVSRPAAQEQHQRRHRRQPDRPDMLALLPMIPMAFLIIRNVSITADDFGDAGRTFTAARRMLCAVGQSSANSIGARKASSSVFQRVRELCRPAIQRRLRLRRHHIGSYVHIRQQKRRHVHVVGLADLRLGGTDTIGVAAD